MDIQNYLHYLDAVYAHAIPPDFSRSITLLGFSQGAATATRWAVHTRFRLDRLILWAGAFPTGMDFTHARTALQSKKLIQVLGDADPFVTDERINSMETLNHQLGLSPQLIRFKGKHEIDAPTLLILA